MRTIIAGSRSITDNQVLLDAIKSAYWDISVVISGTAKGADMLGERWAEANNIPVERFPAEWDKHGRSAGYIRNTDMAKHADALIALWDGKSRGTTHMIDTAKALGLQVFVFNTKGRK